MLDVRAAHVRPGHGAVLRDVRGVPRPEAGPKGLRPRAASEPIVSAVPLCAVCLQPGFFACASCGKPVCDKHVNPKTGLCVSCEGGRLVELPPS